jgi:Uma2 family endonuclease
MVVSTAPVPQKSVTDEWVQASWDEFMTAANSPNLEACRFYYDNNSMRIEMVPLGSSHSQDDPVVSRVISLFATVNNLRIKEIGNGSFRKTGKQECQPDIAFYIGATVPFPPRGSAPINLDEIDPPALVIEIASTTLTDDLGHKRLLYERLGVQEYWVVDVRQSKVIAFEVFEGRSGQIWESKVLPGLLMDVVEEALRRSQTEDDGTVNRWLLQTFTPSV